MPESDDELLHFGAIRRIADIDMSTGSWGVLADDPDRLGSDVPARVFAVAMDQFGEATRDWGLVSSTRVALPTDDVDDDELFELEVAFLWDDELVIVVLSGVHAVPSASAGDVIETVARALHSERVWISEGPHRLFNLVDVARDVRWVVVLALQARIQIVEESVRRALSDEHVSSADYEALREYPVRLAKVERLVGRMPRPRSKDHRPNDPLRIMGPGVIDEFPAAFDGVEDEAREAVARLSGLISSQQVVLTQRQAAEAERFQRLITLVGTAVLVPGLVAAVFGANVGFHGRDKVEAFWAMLLFMVAGGVASYALLRSLEMRVWSKLAERLKLGRLAALSDGVRLLSLVAAALVAFAAGLLVLF